MPSFAWDDARRDDKVGSRPDPLHDVQRLLHERSRRDSALGGRRVSHSGLIDPDTLTISERRKMLEDRIGEAERAYRKAIRNANDVGTG